MSSGDPTGPPARARSWADHWSRGPRALAERFNRLTPREVLPLLEELGFPVRVEPVSHGSVENRVLSFEAGDAERVVIKLYRPGRWSLDGLQEEMRFIRELLAEGVPVVRPIAVRAGGDIGTWRGIHFALFQFVQHEPRACSAWSEEELRDLGRLAARVHAVGRRRAAPNRMVIEPRGMGLENLRYIEQGGLIPGDLLAEYSALGREISARSVPLFEGVPAIRLHGDFGAHNLLRSERGLVVADFDDFMIGPAAFDLCRLYIGLTTPWGDPERDERARDRVTKSFVQGYRDWLELPDEHLRPLEALRGLRHLWNDAWKRARLHDAHFRRARRVMRERSFWLERLDYLRGQSAKLER